MVEIRPVTSRSELKTFVQFYYDFDEMATLRHDKNPSFECCEAQYFLAYKDGKLVGRVAAIINRRANERWNCHQVRFGWFDFIDDEEVSTALLKAVEDWGRQRGMSEIAGPLGFIDTDREGQHMERMEGFKKDNDYVECKVRVPEVVPDKFAKITQMVARRYGLRVHKFTRHELIDEGYGQKVFDLLNATYKDLYGFSQLSQRQIDKLVNDYIKIADLNLVTAVMDGDKMVGFGKILKWHKTPLVDLLLIGVLPEYRAKGANALIFDDLIRQFQAYGFEYAITGPQMETNEGVLSQWQYLESVPYRRHRCYRKIMG